MKIFFVICKERDCGGVVFSLSDSHHEYHPFIYPEDALLTMCAHFETVNFENLPERFKTPNAFPFSNSAFNHWYQVQLKPTAV